MAKKQPAKKDTTVITPRYKVTPKEISNNILTVHEGALNTTKFTRPKPSKVNGVDTTRAKIKANNLNVATTIRRNNERVKEGKAKLPIQGQTSQTSFVEPKGISWKERPIKPTVVKKANTKNKK